MGAAMGVSTGEASSDCVRPGNDAVTASLSLYPSVYYFTGNQSIVSIGH
jgi:hypothetical protein